MTNTPEEEREIAFARAHNAAIQAGREIVRLMQAKHLPIGSDLLGNMAEIIDTLRKYKENE